MKNRSLSFLILFLAVLAITSCKQNKDQLAIYIPKNASAVFVVDSKSIAEKINSSGISLDSLANIFSNSNSSIHWNDIKNSGIDLEKTFYAFTQQESSMQYGKNQNYGLIAPVKDKAKLEEFLKNQSGNSTVQTGSKCKFIHLDRNSIAGWNDDALIVAGLTNSDGDSSTEHLLNSLFEQSESNSITSVDGFNDMVAKQGDVHFFINPSGSLNGIPMLSMTKVNELIDGSYSEGTIDFQNGKAVASFEGHPNKTLSDMMKKYPPQEIKKEMITNFPDSLSAFGAFSFNPKIITEVLHFLGFDSMADTYTSQLGFSVNDVINAISGDMAFMYSGSKLKNYDGAPGSNPSMNSQFLVSIKIGDKTSFEKVMNALVSKNLLSKNGDQYQLGMMGGNGFSIESGNDALLIGSDDALIKAYESGSNKMELPADISKEMNNKSMAIYVDINNIAGKANISDTAGSKMAEMAKATFKDFVATTDKGDGKTYNSSFELNFVNKDENSLASLIKFMAVAHNEEMKHKHDWMMHPPTPPTPGEDSTQQNDDSSSDH